MTAGIMPRRPVTDHNELNKLNTPLSYRSLEVFKETYATELTKANRSNCSKLCCGMTLFFISFSDKGIHVSSAEKKITV